MKRQSFCWYFPIVIVLIFGYGVGVIVFGLQFLNWLPSLTDETARLTIKLFGMGMLGANMYCTKWWAIDLDDAMENQKYLPNAYDFIAYATLIVGGGITGVVLYITLKSGIFLFQSNIEMKIPFALFISFCGGLFHFKVRDSFENAINKMLKHNREVNSSD